MHIIKTDRVSTILSRIISVLFLQILYTPLLSIEWGNAAETTIGTTSLRQAFAEPTTDFCAMPILHSAPIDRDFVGWLQERHAGGTVLDVGIVPGSVNQSTQGEVHCNPTYLNDTERFAKLGNVISEMKRAGLQTWLYDELAYPSGNAGGQVLEGHPEFQSQVLAAQMVRCSGGETVAIPTSQGIRVAAVAIPIVTENNHTSYNPNFNGVVVSLDDAVRLEVTQDAFEWTAPTEIDLDQGIATTWIVCTFGQRASTAWERHDIHRRNVNIMDRRAVAKFIELTHEKYAETLGENLQNIEMFFTDEPQLGASDYWGGNGLANMSPAIAWCDEIPVNFASRYSNLAGGDLYAILPAIFLNVGPKTARYRYAVYDIYCDCIAENYFGQIQDWCHAHGIASTGHMLLEESLLFHLMFTGSLCRNFRRMDLPGVDLLVTPRYRTMPGWAFEAYAEDYSCKLASSMAHLTDGEGVFTESFAVAPKETALQQTRGVAAWQIACGITHFTTYSVQSSLSADDYAKLSDFIGRSLTLCRRGEHVADVAILIPEHSVWATFNPVNGGTFATYQNCNPEAMKIDSGFRDTCHAFAQRQRDFDIVDEQLLETATIENGRLVLGTPKRSETFRILAIPEARMLAPQTLEKIRLFAANGGIVVFAGTLPEMTPQQGMDPLIRGMVRKLLDEYPDTVTHVEFVGTKELVAKRTTEEISQNRERLDRMVTWIAQRCPADLEWNGTESVRMLRRMEGDRWIVYLANPSETPAEGTLTLRTTGTISLWNPETGDVSEIGPITPESRTSLSIPADSARCVVLEP